MGEEISEEIGKRKGEDGEDTTFLYRRSKNLTRARRDCYLRRTRTIRIVEQHSLDDVVFVDYRAKAFYFLSLLWFPAYHFYLFCTRTYTAFSASSLISILITQQQRT